MRLALKVDVDTLRGTLEGVPRIMTVLRALGGEGAPELGAEIDDAWAGVLLERRQPAHRMGGEAGVPLGVGQVER